MDYQLKKFTLNPKIPYGQRLLPTVVDEIAKENPDRVVCKIQKTVDIRKGFLHITIGQVAKAVDYMSYWLENQLKKNNGQQSTISYMGSADIRYWVMILAAIKIGSPIVLPSLKNSVLNNESLYNVTKCRTLFYSSTNVHRATDLAFVMNNELHISEIPTWDDMITQNPKHYPYTDTWETAAKKPILVLHTSGSTGNPKPITYNHAFVNILDAARLVPAVGGQEPSSPAILEQEPGSEFYLGFPFFHLGGLIFFFQPIWYDTVMVLGPVEVPANGKALTDLMKHNKLTTLACPPSLLEDIAKEYKDEFEKYCGHTKIIIYGGGPLAPFAGEYFSKHIPVMAQVMGSTESGFLPLVSKSPEEWQWFYFHPTIGGLHFEQDEDQPDLYELIIKRTTGQEWIQGVFQNFPELNIWRTKDHYRRHPTKQHYWCFVGRVDDMLVLSNGEKFNPVGMETSIAQHPAVRSVIVVGQARFQCAMIIELKDSVQCDPTIISDIWPVIEKANINSPAHAQIDKDLVILTDPKKPFQRAPKGTVQRWKVNKDYAAEVDALYETFASRAPRNSIEFELSSATDESAVHKFLEDVVSQVLPGKQIKDTNDFFVLGLDSLQTSQLSNSINSTLKGHLEASKNISTRFIYENPSIRQLKAAILALATGTSAGTSEDIEDQMRAIVEKCTSHLPAKVTPKPNANGKFNVALTGSTGSLGFYIILALLANPKFDKIYCLDRSPAAEKKFAERWAVLGEEHFTPAPGRMHFYQAEFGHPTFGLADAEYSELSNNVNAIIHNAWKVNFNHPLSSFRSQIDGVKAFTHLSLTSPLHPTLYFVSSISSAGSYPGIIPEQILTDYSVPLPMGYGRSKYASERIMDVAARKADASMTVFRVGQIGGPVLNGLKGQWNFQEWFPSLVKTSGELGIVPDSLGAMDNIEWIPVDVLGRVMVELIQIPPNDPKVEGARVYNFVHPHLASWKNLIPSIQAYYSAKGKDIKVVGFVEWLAKISELGEDELTLEKFPSKKIQDFFEGISQENGMGGGFETGRLVKDSETMKTLPPVGKEWIELWLGQWAY